MDLETLAGTAAETAAMSARYPGIASAIEGERTARMVWSGIAEPGERLAGRLVMEMGPRDALKWALLEFSPPLGSNGKVLSPQMNASQESESPETPRMSPGVTAAWRQFHRRLQPRLRDFDLERELQLLELLAGRVIIPSDSCWPAGFVRLEERAPHALWVVGVLPEETQKKVSIVGARAATSQGTSLATTLAFECAKASLVVISGGAYGIDAAAHRGALRSVQGEQEGRGRGWPPVARSVARSADSSVAPSVARSADSSAAHSSAVGPGESPASPSGRTSVPTVAVLCGGLDNLYPAGNVDLFERVVRLGGALVTEMPPSYRPARWRFLERNRLISAWSDLVVVVEAGLRSGALATANGALDMGVSIGAVPGAVSSPVAAGPNELIKSGATVITGVTDILFQVTGTLDGNVGGAGAGVAGGGEDKAGPGNADGGGAPDGTRPDSGAGGESGSGHSPALGQIRIDNDLLEKLPPIQRRAWDALPASGSASAHVVAREGALGETEAGGALVGLYLAGLVDTTGNLWRRRATINAHGDG